MRGFLRGVQTQFQYDTLNRVTGAATQQTGYLYHRGPTGNLTSALELNGRTVNWTYDGVYRLTGETISLDPAKHNGSVGYGLDPVGNRLSETSSLAGASSGSFGYNADDELSSETYDQNGDVLTSGGKSFSYDAENHLVAMNGGAVQMQYDAFGNRVAKSANGVTTRYLVDDLNPTGYAQVFDELTNGVVTRTYAYGLQRIDEEQIVNNTWQTSYYGYDGRGTVRQLTDPTGAITDTYDYDAYGNHWTVEGSTPNTMLYQGEEWDPDLGFLYLRARYMNPLTGRFLSRDPEDGDLTNPVTLHKYLYAGGDPINKKDPTGRDFVDVAVIDVNAAIRAGVQATLVAAGAVCVLNTAADLLQGLSADMTAPIESITFGFCSAKVRRGCSCTAKCTCHAIGMPNHGNTGIFVTGSGTASSCPAARTLAKQDAGMSCSAGEHAQHCSYRCNGQ